MTGMRIALLILLAAVLAALPGCGLFGFQDWTWHQKLTVVVETPRGEITASSVTVAEWEMPPKWFKIGDSGGGGGAGTLKGEAVVLEVVPGRYLFVLLKGYSPETAVFVLADPPLSGYGREEFRRGLDGLETSVEPRELPREAYPIFATIDDPTNPSTLKQIDADRLDTAFGAGVRLKSVLISVSDEPQTEGRVDAVLGINFFKKWQAQFEEAFRKSRQSGQRPFAFNITRDDFMSGD